MSTLDTGTWNADWAWSLPLIAMNVVIHVFCLGLFMDAVERVLSRLRDRRRFASIFAIVMSVATTVATILHGFEGAIWAGAYRLLGALPDNKSAMRYSINAMTSSGHTNLDLADRWQMMGGPGGAQRNALVRADYGFPVCHDPARLAHRQ